MIYTPILLKKLNCRRILPKEWKFREILPLALKNCVSSKSDRVQPKICVYEMTMLLACLKKNEFDNSECSEEMKAFNECFEKEKAAAIELRNSLKEGLLIPGSHKLSFSQVNQLMQQWPHPGATVRRIKRRPPWMASHKTFRIKRKLAKAQRVNKPVPQWFRLRTGNRIRYNFQPALGMANVSLSNQLKQQYGNLSASLTANVARAQRLTGAKKRAVIEEADRQIREIDELLEQIELFSHDETDEHERKRLTSTISSFRIDAQKLESELEKIRRQTANVDQRAELFNEDSLNENQKALLISNTEILEQTNRRLIDAYDLSLETVDIGAQTLRDLESQREVITKTKSRVRSAHDNIYESSRSLSSIMNRLMRDRFIAVAVGAMFLVVFVLVIYWIVHKWF
ncbi:Vesicle transport through interaction with t-SNAREs -like protein 1A [Trichinella pseudospiralis]|uniref:Vesicle transport through interaction with t-SNAREs-like protein 1A n=1 Tax=Trichinella pseudospiralis TaxID=6337 RepID=A0A0V1FGX0_TRIPS|nr:Vesicle transport through interaction with t-SNAREs -like protein 1A [Trichinella pseudospiralis]